MSPIDLPPTEELSRVEIIMPTYLSETDQSISWLNQAIESVFSQSWQNWHLTIVDDASPLKNLNFIEHWCRSEPEKCSLIRMPSQQGAANARMMGIANTDSQFIAFLDQDDLYRPEKILTQVQWLSTHNDYQAVHTNIEHIDKNAQLLSGSADKENEYRSKIDYQSLNQEELATSIFNRNSIRIISAMFRRSAFITAGGYDCTFNGGEDWELWVRFADRYKIGYISESLLLRRIHTSNTSNVHLPTRLHGLLKACEKMSNNHAYLQPHIQTKIEVIEKRLEKEQQSQFKHVIPE